MGFPLFHLETIGLLLLLAVVLFFWWRTRNRKYRFLGLADPSEVRSIKAKKRKKKKTSSMEEKARAIFTSIYGVAFPSIRPPFLKNPSTGKNLELDGYNPNIHTPLGRGLAFEYDGKQHSQYTPYYHNSKDEFAYQVAKDNWKTNQCRKHGILLIRIPHYVVPFELETFIRNKLKRAGCSIPNSSSFQANQS